MLELDQIDGIKEAANVGAGRAAATLSRLIRRKCDISLPSLVLLDAQGIREHFRTEDSVSVALNVRILGDVPAVMLLIAKSACAQVIVNHMTDVPAPPPDGELPFTARIALKQIGAELSRAFVQSIGEFLKIKAVYDVPELVVESWSDTLDAALAQADEPGERRLLVYCDFFDSNRTFEGKMIYILGPRSQGLLVERLRALLSEAGP